MLSRAARSWPYPTAFGSDLPIIAIAPIARLSVNGVAFSALYASTAWVSASMPVIAVTCAGTPSVTAASRMATSGIRVAWASTFLSPVAASIITVTLVVSDPVPAVVGTAISGRRGRNALCSVMSASVCVGLVTSSATALAASSTEPPPKATTPSHFDSRNCATAAQTSVMHGSPTGHGHSVIATPFIARLRSRAAVIPASCRKLSTMTNICVSPRVCASCPQVLSAPSPHNVTGGTLNVFTRCRFSASNA